MRSIFTKERTAPIACDVYVSETTSNEPSGSDAGDGVGDKHDVGDQLAASLNRRKPSARDQQDAESQAHRHPRDAGSQAHDPTPARSADATSDGSSHVLGALVVYTQHTTEVHHDAAVGRH